MKTEGEAKILDQISQATGKRLLLSLEQLESIFQSIAEPVLVQDKNFKCVFANDLAAKSCGFSNAYDFINASIDQLIIKQKIYTEQGAPFATDQISARRALKGEDFAEAIYVVKAEDGSEKITKSISRPVYDKNGEICYAVTIFRDISSERLAERNSQFLAKASHLFARSLNFQETMKVLADLVVPELADWFGIELVNEHGLLETAYANHIDKSKIDTALKMRKKYPSDPQSKSGSYQVLRTGEPFVYNNFPMDLYLATAQSKEHLDMLKALDLKSVLLMPIKVDDRAIGVLSLCQSDSHRVFSNSDKRLAQDLAFRASFAIEHSKLYSSMQEEQTKLKLAIDAAKLGVFDWNLKTKKLYWSDRTIEIFGYNKEDFKNTYEEYISRIHPDDRESSRRIVEEALKAKRDYTLEHRLLLPDLSIRWILGNGHAYYDKDGEPVRIAGTVKDITWRKKAELAQAKNMQLQQIAVELSNKMETSEVAKTVITKGCRLFGASGGAFLLIEPSGNIEEVFSEGDILAYQGLSTKDKESIKEAIVNTKLIIKNKTNDKSEFITVILSPLISSGKCIGVLRFSLNQLVDAVTPNYVQVLSNYASQSLSRALAFSEAQEEKIRADIANRAKSNFLANMSHEIRTPMNAILGFSKLLSDSSVTEEEREEYMRRVDANGKYLMHLIDDILDLSRVEAGEMRLDQHTFALNELIEDVHTALQILVSEKNIETKIEIAGNVPKSIISDYVRVKQVLMNLLSNSAKFTEEGEIALFISTEDNQVVFDVKDTGVGISASAQKTIFKAFSQGDSSITRKYGGTGLGLILSRKISGALGGQLELIHSSESEGAHFQIRLPLLTNCQEELSEKKKNGIKNITIKPVKILMAEDSPDNQTLLKIYLKDVASRLDVVSNGREALSAAENEAYDVVLMDIQMPGMDGLQATSALRQRGYKAPIIALTAHALPEEVKRSFAAGCNSHLVKPISRSNLIREIARLTSP